MCVVLACIFCALMFGVSSVLSFFLRGEGESSVESVSCAYLWFLRFVAIFASFVVPNILCMFVYAYPMYVPSVYLRHACVFYHYVDIILCTAYFVRKWGKTTREKAWSYETGPS